MAKVWLVAGPPTLLSAPGFTSAQTWTIIIAAIGLFVALLGSMVALIVSRMSGFGEQLKTTSDSLRDNVSTSTSSVRNDLTSLRSELVATISSGDREVTNTTRDALVDGIKGLKADLTSDADLRRDAMTKYVDGLNNTLSLETKALRERLDEFGTSMRLEVRALVEGTRAEIKPIYENLGHLRESISDLHRRLDEISASSVGTVTGTLQTAVEKLADRTDVSSKSDESR